MTGVVLMAPVVSVPSWLVATVTMPAEATAETTHTAAIVLTTSRIRCIVLLPLADDVEAQERSIRRKGSVMARSPHFGAGTRATNH
ncbi:hypothetical protein [Methylobacterium oryzisoli]|uniref:hypothetical protein n=1 Tax=Methylobacterium oryzisoli TaxID=3385502 RepID=UPI0038919FC0